MKRRALKHQAKNKRNNEHWWLIVAKDNSRQGYWTGKPKEEACKNFGLEITQCSIKEVVWSGEEFIEFNQAEQIRLL